MEKAYCIFCGESFEIEEAKNKLYFVLCYRCYYEYLAHLGYKIRQPLLPYYTTKNIVGDKQ